MRRKCHVYVASPYGFAESTKGFMKKYFHPAIRKAGCVVVNPWRHKLSKKPNHAELMKLGKVNAKDIEEADGLVAALDGPDVDSGTAAEVGYAAAKGKWIIGYRGDFRKTGENSKVKLNLQVEYFILGKKGIIVDTLRKLKAVIRTRSRQTMRR